jgi:hypothetical protein
LIDEEPPAEPPDASASSDARFDIVKWCQENMIPELAPKQAVAMIRAKHAELIEQGVWTRTSSEALPRGAVVGGEASDEREGLLAFHVIRAPRMELTNYSSLDRFFVDLTASVLLSSSAETKTARLLILSRALDGVSCRRQRGHEVSRIWCHAQRSC